MNQGATLALALADTALLLLVGSLLIPVLRGIRQPPVIAEILAGIILGPSVLGLLPGHLLTHLFPAQVRADLSAIALVGILLFMFLAGWEMDLVQARSTQRTVLAVWVCAVTVPFGAGAALATWLYRTQDMFGGHRVEESPFVLFIGAAMAITAFPVLARLIADHGLQGTRMGTVALAASGLGDATAWCVLAAISAFTVAGTPRQLISVVGYSVLYVLALALIVRPALHWGIGRWARGEALRARLFVLTASGLFISAYVTQVIGLDAIFGAFAFGLAMPRDSMRTLWPEIGVPMTQVTTLLMPVYFISAGLAVNVASLDGNDLLGLVAVIAVACAGKLGGATLAARLSGLRWRESSILGVLMNTRGLTELIVLSIGMSLGILNDQTFTIMALMALVTTALTGPLVPRAEMAGNPSRNDTPRSPSWVTPTAQPSSPGHQAASAPNSPAS
jgi:Kef-type K+ transport system membrane component KefB